MRELRCFNAGDAKVSDLDVAVRQHDQVGRLHVAVGHAFAVGVFQRIQNFAHDAAHFLQREAFIAIKGVFEFLARHKLHGDKGHPLAISTSTVRARHHGAVILSDHFAVVIHGHDARVVESASRLGFAFEAGQYACDFATVQLGWQNSFDGHRALDYGVKALVHDAHRALAQLATNQILTEFGHGRHCVPLNSKFPFIVPQQ